MEDKRRSVIMLIAAEMLLATIAVAALTVGILTRPERPAASVSGTPAQPGPPNEPAGTVEPSATVTSPETADAGRARTSIDPEWDVFAGLPVEEARLSRPTARDARILAEVHATLYPAFTVEESFCEKNHVRSGTTWADALYVRASLTADPQVQIAYVLYVAPEDGHILDPRQRKTGEVAAQTPDGTRYVYYEYLVDALGGEVDPKLASVLANAQDILPGMLTWDVVLPNGDDRICIYATKWDVFLSDPTDGFLVYYEPSDSPDGYVYQGSSRMY